MFGRKQQPEIPQVRPTTKLPPTVPDEPECHPSIKEARDRQAFKVIKHLIFPTLRMQRVWDEKDDGYVLHVGEGKIIFRKLTFDSFEITIYYDLFRPAELLHRIILSMEKEYYAAAYELWSYIVVQPKILCHKVQDMVDRLMYEDENPDEPITLYPLVLGHDRNEHLFVDGEAIYLCEAIDGSYFTGDVRLLDKPDTTLPANSPRGCYYVDNVRGKICVPVDQLKCIFRIKRGNRDEVYTGAIEELDHRLLETEDDAIEPCDKGNQG